MIINNITDTINTLIKEIKKHDSDILCGGDGSVSFKERFENEFGNKAHFMPYHLNEQTAISVAKAAHDKALLNDYDSVDALHPLYLRKSQAERALEEK